MVISKKFLGAALALGAIGIAAAAFASPVPVGDPFHTGSWSQGWNDAEGFAYDAIGMVILSGSDFESPAFSNGTLTQHDNGTGFHTAATMAIGDFSPTTDAGWNNNFMGSGPPVIYDWFLYEPGHDVASAAYRVFSAGTVGGDFPAGGGWSYSVIDSTVLRSAFPVPLPAAAGVGFSMLGGFGGLAALRKRIRGKPRIA